MYEFISSKEKKIKAEIEKAYMQNRIRLTTFNELNLLESRKQNTLLFARIEKIYRDFYKELEKQLQKELHFFLPENYIARELDKFNPTLLFVFDNEFERKRQRYLETVNGILESNMKMGMKPNVAAGSLAFMQNMKRAIRSTQNQIIEEAIKIERDATLEKMRDNGIKYVRWITATDERVCEECGALHGKIFPIDELPDQPHIHCRCGFEETEKQ